MNSMDAGLISGKLGRIAGALERIADALEENNKHFVAPFYPVPAYPTPGGTGDPLPDEFTVTCGDSQLGSPGMTTATNADAPTTNTGE